MPVDDLCVLEEVDVKKLVVLAIAAAAGFLVWKKFQDDQAEQDLWTEATDDVRSAPPKPASAS